MRWKLRQLQLIGCLFLGIMAVPQFATPQVLSLTDCHGFTRAVKSVNQGSLNRVEVQVSSSTTSTEGTQVTVTNTVTGQANTAVVKGGVASFEGLAPGTYTMSTAVPSIQVGAVSISGATALSTAAAAGVVAGAGAATGAGVVGVGVAVDTAVNQISESPSDGAEETPTPLPTVEPTVEPEPTSTPMPTPTEDPCGICDPDAEPTPISDFFGPDEQPAKLSPYALNHRCCGAVG